MIKSFPLYFLFFWYLLFTGLNEVIPYYSAFGNVIMVILLIISFLPVKGFAKEINFKYYFLVISLIVISALLNKSSFNSFMWTLFYFIRPFSILFYIVRYKVMTTDIIYNIVKTCRIVLYANLPFIIFNVFRYGSAIIKGDLAGDYIAGFFPFENNDSLVFVYVILLSYDIYFILNRPLKRFLVEGLIIFTIFILSLNLKVIFLLFAALLLIYLKLNGLRIFRRFRSVFLIVTLALISIPFLLKATEKNYNFGAILVSSPTMYTYTLLLTGSIPQYSYLLGAGPGNFTSPQAIETGSRLAGEYGLTKMYEYFRDTTGLTTGTFTSITSSALIFIGEDGILVASLVFILLLNFSLNLFREVMISFQNFIGFIFSVIVIIVGFLLGDWSWGPYNFMFIIAYGGFLLQNTDLKNISSNIDNNSVL